MVDEEEAAVHSNHCLGYVEKEVVADSIQEVDPVEMEVVAEAVPVLEGGVVVVVVGLALAAVAAAAAAAAAGEEGKTALVAVAGEATTREPLAFPIHPVEVVAGFDVAVVARESLACPIHFVFEEVPVEARALRCPYSEELNPKLAVERANHLALSAVLWEAVFPICRPVVTVVVEEVPVPRAVEVPSELRPQEVVAAAVVVAG